MLIIGFDSSLSSESGQVQLIIGEPSPSFPSFHVKLWKNIDMELRLGFPEFYDIRREHEGVQLKTEKKKVTGKLKGENKHCIL